MSSAHVSSCRVKAKQRGVPSPSPLTPGPPPLRSSSSSSLKAGLTGKVLPKDQVLGLLERLGIARALDDQLGRVNVLELGVGRRLRADAVRPRGLAHAQRQALRTAGRRAEGASGEETPHHLRGCWVLSWDQLALGTVMHGAETPASTGRGRSRESSRAWEEATADRTRVLCSYRARQARRRYTNSRRLIRRWCDEGGGGGGDLSVRMVQLGIAQALDPGGR